MKAITVLTFCLILGGNIFSQTNTPALGACGSGGVKGNLPQNGSGSLGMTYNQSNCGLNYVVTNKLIETRYNAYTTAGNLGSGLPTTLTISGIPACATILKAYIWYYVSYISSPQATSVVLTNPTPSTSTIAATNIGQSVSKCWGEAGTVNYRADVTAAVTGNGNYGINITGITGTSANFANWYDQIDGVCMMVIYKDNNATYQGSLVLWDGAVSSNSGGASTQTMTGINACAAGTNAKAFLLVSDMQDNQSGNQHPSTINGVTSNYPNNFWCWDQAASTTITAGQATANFGTDGQFSDCYDWGLMGIYYQTTTCTTCVNTSMTTTVTSTASTCTANNGSASVTASGGTTPYTYSWNTTPPQTTPTATGLAPGVYIVTVNDASGCFSNTDTVTVPSAGGFTITPSQVNVTCFGGNNASATVAVAGGTTPYTYAWATNPVQTGPGISGIPAGNYTCVVADGTGCTSISLFTITQPAALTGSITASTNVSCFGGNDGSATAAGSGGTGVLNYLWNTSPAQANATANNLIAGNYIVTITDANNCTITQSVTITQPQGVNITTSSTVASCGVNDGTATVTASGGAAPHTYLWLTTPVQTSPTATGLGPGVYTIIVTDANGCTQQQSISVGGGTFPIADFNFAPDEVSLLDPQVAFFDLSSGNPVIWSWNFGDSASGANNVSSVQHPQHLYSDTGTYCITLVISDLSGVCVDSIVKCLRVEAPYTFYIPNTFTPNNDLNNEMFLGYGTNIKDFHIMIFDRWGNKIFESYNIMMGWNGKVKNVGDLVQEDVYVWKVEITDVYLQKHKYIGHVNMVK